MVGPTRVDISKHSVAVVLVDAVVPEERVHAVLGAEQQVELDQGRSAEALGGEAGLDVDPRHVGELADVGDDGAANDLVVGSTADRLVLGVAHQLLQVGQQLIVLRRGLCQASQKSLPLREVRTCLPWLALKAITTVTCESQLKDCQVSF